MYSLDYNQKVIETLVPDKRMPITTAYLQALVKDISNNHIQLFETYKQYQLLDDWIPATYTKNTLIKYSKSIYQAVDDTSDTPSYSNMWRLVSENYQGNDFRLSVTSEKLVLEYALNDWFGSMFRQPIDGISDIFLTTNEITESPFLIGLYENESSKIFTDTSSEFIVNNYTFLNQFNLTINVPIALYNTLGSTDNIRQTIIRSYADKYVASGITYNIITY